MIPLVLLAPESAQAARFFWHYATNKIRKDSAPCIRAIRDPEQACYSSLMGFMLVSGAVFL
ncbi:hypothetical protein A9196_11435 [Aeromonas dhakensis]|nr:hypothetical protein A9196_11435 [Aeromonas dhakensis]